MKASEVVLFETELESRAAASGWNSNAQGVTKFNNSDGNSIDLIKEYGKIDLETLKNACEPFITGNQKHTRRAQNNANALECILSSLDETARKRVLAYHKDYTINKQVVFPLLYKTIMRLATLDSTATDSALRNNIRNILEYAISKNWDIDEVISYIDENYSQLKARGKSMDDANVIVMEMLSKANDASFAKYWTDKLDDYWNETEEMKEIMVETISRTRPRVLRRITNLGEPRRRMRTRVEAVLRRKIIRTL